MPRTVFPRRIGTPILARTAALSLAALISLPLAAVPLHAADVSRPAEISRVKADSTISPDLKERAALRRLVQSDPEARALFAAFTETANDALKDTPNPIAIIQSEGKLAKDPVKIRTQASLRDMPKIAALGWAAAVQEKPVSDPSNAYARKAKEFILAWADTNQSQGNPINDTKLEPLLVAYDLTRTVFTPEEQARVTTYLRQMVKEGEKTRISNPGSARSNWNSHRLKVTGLIAFLLQDPVLIKGAIEGYRRQVDENLLPDGSSTDFHHRDALHYHLYDIEPLLTLAIAARRNGTDLYSYRSPSKASLAHSTEWLIPYCDGSKTHAEFVNSKVSFDQKRAASGDAHYAAGRLFNPRQALSALALAAAFDPPGKPRFETLEKAVAGKPTARFASWQDVLNKVSRGETP
ncbi:MAG: alginate lyase family protein [Armatimonadota bacterium]